MEPGGVGAPLGPERSLLYDYEKAVHPQACLLIYKDAIRNRVRPCQVLVRLGGTGFIPCVLTILFLGFYPGEILR